LLKKAMFSSVVLFCPDQEDCGYSEDITGNLKELADGSQDYLKNPEPRAEPEILLPPADETHIDGHYLGGYSTGTDDDQINGVT